MQNLLEKLLNHGEIGVLSAALLLGLGSVTAALIVLWRRNIHLQDALYNLAIEKVRTDEKVHATLKGIVDYMRSLPPRGR